MRGEPGAFDAALLAVAAARAAPGEGGYELVADVGRVGWIAVRADAVDLRAREGAWRVRRAGRAWDFAAQALPAGPPVASFRRGPLRPRGRFSLGGEDAAKLRGPWWLGSSWELTGERARLALLGAPRQGELDLEIEPAARAQPQAALLLLFATWLVVALRGLDLAVPIDGGGGV